MAEASPQGFFTPTTVEDPLQKNKKKSKGKYIFILIFLLFLGGLGFGGYLFWQRLSAPTEETPGTPPETPTLTGNITGEIATGATEEDVENSFGSARFASENFRIGDVAIAGEAEFILTEDTIEPLALSGIRGDTFAEKNSQDVSLIVSWRTNKLARSEVAYSKGAGQPERVIREAQYGFTHSLIIPDLDPGATYIYVIRTSDRFGNTVTSDPYAIYTGSQEASLFDLIADTIGDIFGWAMR